MMDSIDQLKIDTPEQIALELPLAGIGSRFLALAIDTLLQSILYFLIFLVFFIGMAVSFSSFTFFPKLLGPALAIFLVFCVYWGYFALFEGIWKGQTPGKRFAGIRVIKESGRPINAFESIGRNFMRAVDGMPGFYGVGLVCMMLNKQSRRLGDYVAGTVVVHEKLTAEVRPSWNTSVEQKSTSPEIGRATTEDLVLIETYLHRRWDLDPAVRMRTAVQIAERLKAKTGLQAQPNQHVDDFLEDAARQIRDTAHFI